MKFMINRASLWSPKGEIQPHAQAKPEQIQYKFKRGDEWTIWEETVWIIEINSLEELIEFIERIPDDPCVNEYSDPRPAIILHKSWKFRDGKIIKGEVPEWEIVIYDDYYE